jgi:photosystem II stability/assembly factor-like uncharacterized protein
MKLLKVIFLFFILQALAVSGQDFWEEVILPDSVENIFSVNFNSQNQVFICTEEGVFISFDNGLNWEFLVGFISSTIEISTSDEIYLGLDSQNRILYSNSYGLEWDTIQTNFSLGGRIKLINDSLLFAFDWGWIYKSADSGYTWNQVLQTTGDLFIDLVEKDGILFSGSINYLISSGGGIHNSLDFGDTWQHISLPGYGISSFALNIENNLLCGVNFQYSGQEYGVFSSQDSGYYWENILSGHYVTSLAVDKNGGIYAGCDSDFGPEGVQFSPDNGISWSSLNTGLHENASITKLDLSPTGYLFAKTIFPTKLYRNINPIVNITSNEKPPRDLTIFPNPCNNILSIRYKDLHPSIHDQNYEVKIINYLGTVVIRKRLILGLNFENSLNIAPLSSGVYVIVIYSKSEILRAKLIKE